ncbi:MAG TPA: T9SS type A sorting domain-containing protein [Bacteroidota bacterium]|nr:T9SS type A sorting domain-containing protein [Bacteroidota bacterium]
MKEAINCFAILRKSESVLRWVLRSTIVFLLSSIVAYSQATNLDPVYYVEHSDVDRIVSESKFIEQRVMLWDSGLFEYLLDSLVQYNSVDYPKSSIVGTISALMSCSSVSDSLLMMEYAQRGDFYSFFRIDECIPQRALTSMAIGDTITFRMKIRVASDLPAVHSMLTFKKLYSDVTLPVMNYRIVKIDDAFLESIGGYIHSFAVRYLAETGGIPVEWRTTANTYELWDFQEDEPRSCVQHPNYLISSNTLQKVPIQVVSGNNTYEFNSINSSVVIGALQFEIAGDPADIFAAYDGNISNSHTVFLKDRNWNRILIGNLQSGCITSQPFKNTQNQYFGQKFGRLGPISISDAETVCGGALKCVAFDADSSVLHTFEINFNEPSALAYKQRFEMPGYSLSTVFWSPPGQGNWLHLSGEVRDTSFIIMGYPQTHRRYIGYSGICDSALFMNTPLVAFPSYFTAYVGDMVRYHRGQEQLGFVLGSKMFTTRNQPNYYVQGLMNEFIPVKSCIDFKRDVGFTNLSCVSRMKDGHYLITDNTRGLVHVVEAFDGKYVCSWSTEGDFEDLLSCRQTVDMVEDNRLSRLYEEAVVDLFTLENWNNSSGISRYLTAPEMLNISRIKSGDSTRPDIVKFIVTARSSIDIQLVDDQLNVVDTIEENVLRDPRLYTVAIDNPQRYRIQLSIRSADNPNYGVNMHADREYVIMPNGAVVVPKKTIAEESVETIRELDVYPNPVRRASAIFININNPGTYQYELYDTKGSLLMSRQIDVDIPGTHAMSLDLPNGLAGVYIVRIRSDKSIYTAKVLVQ